MLTFDFTVPREQALFAELVKELQTNSVTFRVEFLPRTYTAAIHFGGVTE